MLNIVVSGARFAQRYWRPVTGLSLVLALGLMVIPASRYVEASPLGQFGPPESTSGTVVSVSGGTFQLERPALSNPTALEQVTVQPPAGVTVASCDIVAVTGRYNIPVKVFEAETLNKLGSACQPPTTSTRELRPTDIDSSLDNENEDDDDNDND